MRLSVFAAACAVLLSSAFRESAFGQQVGQKVTTAGGNTVTVYSIAWPNDANPVRADVEVCAGATATFAFPSYFQVHFADGGAIGSLGSHKQPTLERTHLEPKQCARGWLDFIVTSGQKPVSLHYHEAAADKKPIDWAVK